jgi:hypothetical protein
VGNGFEAGGGTGVAGLGPLQQMWRDVYRKAGEAAEERATELLKYHVYVYPHGAGGGTGGGGGWVLLYAHEVSAPAGELTLRLPDTGTLPQTYDSLVLEVRARSTATGTTRDTLTLTVNPEAATFYNYTLTRNDTGTVTGFGSSNDSTWDIGSCPRAGALAGTFSYTTVQLPWYARTDAKKGYLAHNETAFGTSDGGGFTQESGGWASPVTGAITYLTLRPGFGEFAQGTLVRVWGVTDAAGGGGTADVTITTDASLTSTESPANTFALAARLSADAGNALSLHANGLYSTDTGGGGGTGNTTMYTQTGTPTGATNSLWFNPSEAA